MTNTLRRRVHSAFVALFIFLMLINLLGTGTTIQAQDSVEQQVESLLQSMTLEQRVGQMFMVSVYGIGLNDAAKAFLREMMPGASAFFSYNGTNPREINYSVNEWQATATSTGAKIPLLIGIDHEGGSVTRLTSGVTLLPWGAALGAMPTDDAKTVGFIAGQELSAMGIQINFAPVVDVRTLPGAFVERRTFSNKSDVVSKAGAAYIEGLHEAGVMGALKHFPGHGPAGDSHTLLPVVNSPLDQIEAVELPPFKAGIDAGVEIVMMGHLYYPALDSTPNLPSSLSPVIIGDILRKQLGFEGIVMTDGMDMAAISEHFDRPLSAVMAVKAGNDWITTGPHIPMPQQLAMKKAVIDAVNHGEITEKRINESVRRILLLKAKHNLLSWTPLDPGTVEQRVQMEEHQNIVDHIYLNTVTVAQDKQGLLPLQPGAKKVTYIYPGAFPLAQRACKEIDSSASGMSYSLNVSAAEQSTAFKKGQQSDVVVIFTFNIDQYPGQTALVNNIPPEKAIVVALQSPYDIEQNIHPDGYVVAFNSYPGAIRAACQVLYGTHQVVGTWSIN